MFQLAEGTNIMFPVLLGGLFVMGTTSLGALAAVAFRRVPSWGLDLSMAFSGGIMLVASFTSLILPAIDMSNALVSSGGIVAGFMLILLVERYVPHEHIVAGHEGPEEFRDKLRHVWLIAIALIIHNLPEGMAVGVSIVSDLHRGLATTIAIGIQDIPEGLAVTLPLILATDRVGVAILVGVLSGASELLMALLGGCRLFLYEVPPSPGFEYGGGCHDLCHC